MAECLGILFRIQDILSCNLGLETVCPQGDSRSYCSVILFKKSYLVVYRLLAFYNFKRIMLVF